MSQLNARIETIDSEQSLNIVTFLCAEQKLQMVSLALNESVQVGKAVTLACKPTSVAIAKPTVEVESFCAVLSYANQLRVEVVSIERGVLLSSVMLALGSFELESILSTSALERLSLKAGDEVIALIKANELSILAVSND